MAIRERLTKMIEPILDLIKRLTMAQRVSLVFLAGAVVIGLLMLMSTIPSSSAMVRVPGATPEFMKLLQDNSVDYETGRAGEVLVKRSDLPALLTVFYAEGQDQSQPDHFAWLLDEVGFSGDVPQHDCLGAS